MIYLKIQKVRFDSVYEKCTLLLVKNIMNELSPRIIYDKIIYRVTLYHTI